MTRDFAVLMLLGLNAWVDVKKREIVPWSVLLFGAGGCLLAAAEGTLPAELVPSLLPGALLAAVSLLSGGAVGMGDSLLLLALGPVMSPEEILLLLGLSFFLCGTVSFVLLLRHAGRKTQIPFVPFLLCGFVGGLLL